MALQAWFSWPSNDRPVLPPWILDEDNKTSRLTGKSGHSKEAFQINAARKRKCLRLHRKEKIFRQLGRARIREIESHGDDRIPTWLEPNSDAKFEKAELGEFFKVPFEYDLDPDAIKLTLKRFQADRLCDLRERKFERDELKNALSIWCPFKPDPPKTPGTSQVRDLTSPEQIAQLVAACWPTTESGIVPECKPDLNDSERKSISRDSLSSATALARKVLEARWKNENDKHPVSRRKTSIQKPNFASLLKQGMKRFRDQTTIGTIDSMPSFLTSGEYVGIRLSHYNFYIDTICNYALTMSDNTSL